MENTISNPYAFPQTEFNDTAHSDFNGMMLRDYFAAKAMQQMCAGDGARMLADRDGNYNENLGNWADVVARNAYDFADAMLKQRSV